MPDNGTHYIKQHDTLPNLRAINIQWGDGTDMVFAAGDAAQFIMKDLAGNPVATSGAVTLDTGQNSLTYAWVAGDTDTAGIFLAEIEVTFSAGGKATIPNDGYYQIKIDADLDGS